MDATFITAITSALSADKLWGALTPIAPLVGVLVVFALGVHFVRKAVSGAGKGKAKI